MKRELIQGHRKQYALPILVICLLFSAVYLGAAANQALNAGQFTRLGEEAGLLQMEVNHTGTSGTLEDVTVNFTGSNTTQLGNLVSNVTVWNMSGTPELYGYNDNPSAWTASGPGYVFNVSNITTAASEISANDTTFRLNITLGSSGDGSAVDFAISQLHGTNVEPSDVTLPYSGGADTNVTVDETPPAVTITTPAETANLSGSGNNLDVTVSNDTTNGRDSGVDRNSVEYIFENSTGQFDASGTPDTWTSLPHSSGDTHSTTFDVSGLADGDYAIRIRANDTVDIGADNRNDTQFVNVTVDNTAPSITPTQPADNSIVTGTFFVNATWTDALTGVSTVMFNVTNSSGSWQSGTLNNTFDSSTLADGTYTVNYNATDFAGNTVFNTSFIDVTVDNNPPASVTLTEFTTATTTYNGWKRDNHTVEVACSDAGSGVNDTSVFTGGSQYRGWNATVPSNFTIDTTGDTTYNFRCRDNAGFVNQSQNLTIKVDASAPAVSSSSPSDGATGTETSFTFTASFNDESTESWLNESASTLQLNTGGASGSMAAPTWDNSSVSADVSSLDKDTSYTITGFVVDNVGHNHSVNIGFTTKSDSTSTSTSSSGSTNDAPTADAGGPYTVMETENITLNGTKSSDPDTYDTLSYLWDVTKAHYVSWELTGETTAIPTFTAPSTNSKTNITIELTVEDDSGATDTDAATITVLPEPEPEKDTTTDTDDQSTSDDSTTDDSTPQDTQDNQDTTKDQTTEEGTTADSETQPDDTTKRSGGILSTMVDTVTPRTPGGTILLLLIILAVAGGAYYVHKGGDLPLHV